MFYLPLLFFTVSSSLAHIYTQSSDGPLPLLAATISAVIM